MLAAAVLATDIRIVPLLLYLFYPPHRWIRWEPKRLCLRSRYRHVVLLSTTPLVKLKAQQGQRSGLECLPHDSDERVLSSCQAKEISESIGELLDPIPYLRSLSDAIATAAQRRSTILTPPSRQGSSR